MSDLLISDKIKSNYEDYYNDDLSKWRELGALDKSRNIIALCKPFPHRTILEIGAGEGAVLNRLADLQFGSELFGLEISKTGVEAIRKRKISTLVDAQLFDGVVIPYETNRFDIAILSHVVEHLEHPRSLILEAGRVARHVFVEVPLEDNFRLGNDFVFNEEGHINFYSYKTIRSLIQTCDLEILSQLVTNSSRAIYALRFGQSGNPKYIIKQLLLKIAPSLACSLWTYNSSLVCKKIGRSH